MKSNTVAFTRAIAKLFVRARQAAFPPPPPQRAWVYKRQLN